MGTNLKCYYTWFKASTVTQIRSLLFWDVMQCWLVVSYQSSRTAYPLAVERHLYMLRCEVFKEPNDIYIYIYIYMSQPILFTPNMHTAEFCFAVDSWRSGLRCVATVAPPPPLPSQTLWRAPLLYVNTYQLCIYCSWLTGYRHRTSCLWLETEFREAWISISAYETSRNCWSESFQWHTVTHILRQKPYTKIGDIHRNWCLQIQ